MIPLSWTCLAWRGRAFWREVIAVLELRGYRPAHRASRPAVLSAIAAARERLDQPSAAPVDGMSELFGG